MCRRVGERRDGAGKGSEWERGLERGVRVLVRVLCDSEGVDEGAIKGECAGDRDSVGAGEGRVLLRVRIWGQ